MTPSIDWRGLFEETRLYLGEPEGAAIPQEELKEQARSVGYTEGEISAAWPPQCVSLADSSDPNGEIVLDAETESEADSTEEEEEDGSSDDEAVAVGRERAEECFAAAVRYMHTLIDREVDGLRDDLETPREYFEEHRGWKTETVSENLLGWAPTGQNDLMLELHEQGFSREEMLATGLFGVNDSENIYPMWKGRYVLPYFVDGEPVFAITRQAADVDADWKKNKYDKPTIARDSVPITEPIYGVDSVETGKPLLITEGIADAISAHEHGYPCISPVTTKFADSDSGELLEIIDEYDVPRVYIVQDAERPGVEEKESTGSERITDSISLVQHPSGVSGAVSTGAFLEKHDVDARVITPPRPGLSKVDVDDYLVRWQGSLRPLFARAVPATDHPAYEEDGETESENRSSSRREWTGGSSGSRLFDLSITDVTPLSSDGRANNPLGHHGGERPWSEGYYVVDKEGETAYDHKYKVTYNALTHILCEMGERSADSPEGALTDQQKMEVWVHAKEESYIPDDDPVPYVCLLWVAKDSGVASEQDLPGEEKGMNPRAYNAALSVIKAEYGVNPGREKIGDEQQQETGEQTADAVTEADDGDDPVSKVKAALLKSGQYG